MIALSDTPLDLGALVEAVGDPEHGGLVTFLGTTRRESGRRPVRALRYQAYEELALAELSAVRDEAASRFGAAVAIAHRTGEVAAGQPSVAVVASAGHRPAAFAACRYAIDELKARVPIWKQTVYEDGETSWIDGRDTRSSDPHPPHVAPVA